MIKLRLAMSEEKDKAMQIIEAGRAHLKAQGINHWQNGYPDQSRIEKDLQLKKGYFVVDENDILGYLCIDFDGEPAYASLNGEWGTSEKYVVVHRMAFNDDSRGKGLASAVFDLVEALSREKNVFDFRIDTDDGNEKMKHILTKYGFTYRGLILFENSVKIGYDKKISVKKQNYWPELK